MASELADAFYKKSKVILVWPLGGSVRLGSVGFFDAGQWVEVSTTDKMFGLTLAQNTGSSNPNSFDGKSGRGFTFEAKAEGEASALVPAIAVAKARLEISFGSAGAFALNVKNQSVVSAQKLAELMSAIRYAYRFRDDLKEGKRWEKKYALIVGLANAESVTALSALSKKASAVITGSGSGPAPTTIAELDASMRVSFSRESIDKLWVGPAKGYAFQALRIKPSIFTRWDKEDVGFVQPDDIAFASMAIRRVAPKPPTSYAAWAKKERLVVEEKAAELLSPADAASSRRARAAKPAGSETRKRAATKRAAKKHAAKKRKAPARKSPKRKTPARKSKKRGR